MYFTSKILIALAMLLSLPCHGQWTDSFNDGNFSKDPVWTGDTSCFIVNQQLQLQLNAPAVSGKSSLVSASAISSDAEWKFRINLDFNTSSSNYARVFLISDSPRLDSALCGYYLRIGSGDDNISLYRQEGTTSKLILDGPDDMTSGNQNKLSVKITRSAKGQWILFCDTLGNSNYFTLGSALDTTFWHSDYFGVQCVYTSTRSKKFSFDDFSVSGKSSNDSIPPRIESYKAINDTSVNILLTEAMDIRTIELISVHNPENLQKIKTIRLLNKNELQLTFTPAISCNLPLELKFSGLRDISGNAMPDTVIRISYCPGQLYDVIIDEIMADPDPAVSLPNVEFLELHNRTTADLNLEGWVLQSGDDMVHIPTAIIPSRGFLILANSNGCSLFPEKGPCLDVLPAYCLTNDGNYLGLRNKSGKLIHWVNYKKEWYKDILKENGGWSLEMIDTENPCLGSENWKASSNPKGGSPLEKNAASGNTEDTETFKWLRYAIPNDSTVRIYFSGPLDLTPISNNSFEVDNGMGAPESIFADSLSLQYLDLIYRKPFQGGTTYTLEFPDNLSGCSGSSLNLNKEIYFGLPSRVESGDILLNEILFNPSPGGNEYVEIYNNSTKFLNTNEILFTYRTTDGDYEHTWPLGDYPFLIAPHSFLVLTASIKGLTGFYNINDERYVTEIPSFPNLNNQEGCIKLINNDLHLLDEFCYSEKFHFPLLVNYAGVSLERISYQHPGQDAANWHSAASSEGFGTPGRINSQYLENLETTQEITLEEEIFSPDNDGNKDVQTLRYNLSKSGYVANVVIFDASGRKVKTLANNLSIGTDGFLEWNGLDDKGRLAPIGIYLFYTELHHPSGDVKQYKNICVLGGKLNQ